MQPPSSILDGASVLCWAETRGIEKTGECTFRADGHEQRAFAGLAIALYSGDSRCYLFLCNEAWETENDTLHESLEEAKAFAEALYPGIGARWRAT